MYVKFYDPPDGLLLLTSIHLNMQYCRVRIEKCQTEIANKKMLHIFVTYH